MQYSLSNHSQCSKLRVHPAPSVHIFAAGCIYVETSALLCACYSQLLNRFIQ